MPDNESQEPLARSVRRRANREIDWDSVREESLRVSELFVSVQGEGSRTGLPTFFLRLTGCALRCRWCDTEWAFTGGDQLRLDEIESRILDSGTSRVCVTGGEPLLQRRVLPLIERLHTEHGLEVVVETGGDRDIGQLPREAVVILDVKLPGSGMDQRMDPRNIERLMPHDEVKLVISGREDYEVARGIVADQLAGFDGEILFGAVAGELEASVLAAWILEDRLDVRLQTQLHKALWPGKDRGV